MKKRTSVVALSIVALLGATSLQAGWRGYGQAGGQMMSLPAVSVEPLTEQEMESLLFLREEEKLARDVYLTLYEKWNHPVFSNISRSEQRHMDAVGARLDAYALADPIADDSVGYFTNTQLAGMYADLSTKGQTSLLDALYVGALIEEVDIQDLQNAIAASAHPDLIRTYENLMRGSRNHLRAFVSQIEGLGEPYEAQVMDQTEVDAILDQPLERGRAARAGRGRGRW